MNTRDVGGAFLLQESEPTRLLGSLGSYIDENVGWVQCTFFSEPGVFEVARENDTFVGSISRSVCMSLIAIFQVTLAQLRYLRVQAGAPASSATPTPPLTSAVRVDKNGVAFSFGGVAAEVSVAEVDGQTELRLTETFVPIFLAALVDALGRFSINAEGETG